MWLTLSEVAHCLFHTFPVCLIVKSAFICATGQNKSVELAVNAAICSRGCEKAWRRRDITILCESYVVCGKEKLLFMLWKRRYDRKERRLWWKVKFSSLFNYHAVHMCLVLEVWCNLFFNLGTRSRWVHGFMPPQFYSRRNTSRCPLDSYFGGSQSRCGVLEEKVCLFDPETEPHFVGGPTRSLNVKVNQSH